MCLPWEPLLSPDPADHPRPHSLGNVAIDTSEPAEGFKLGVMRSGLWFRRLTLDAAWVVDEREKEPQMGQGRDCCNCAGKGTASHLSKGAVGRACGVRACLIFELCPVHVP